MRATVLGGLIIVVVFALGVYGVEMGIPYLLHRSSLPWAGPAGSPSSLLGVWVGQVDVRTASSSDPVSAPTTKVVPAAVFFEVGLNFMWGVPKVKGIARICTADGFQSTSTYKLEPMHDPSNFQVLLRQNSSSTSFTELEGHFSPGTLRIQWPFRSEDDIPSPHPVGAAGILHKGDASEFGALCSKL